MKKEVKIQHPDEKYFKKYFSLYLYRKEKEVILQHLDEKKLKYFSSLLNKYGKIGKNAGY